MGGRLPDDCRLPLYHLIAFAVAMCLALPAAARGQARSGAKALRDWEAAALKGKSALNAVAIPAEPRQFVLRVDSISAASGDQITVRASCKATHDLSDEVVRSVVGAWNYTFGWEPRNRRIAQLKADYDKKQREKNPHPRTINSRPSIIRDPKHPVKQRKRNPDHTAWSKRHAEALKKLREKRVALEQARGKELQDVRATIDNVRHEFEIQASALMVEELGLKAGQTKKLAVQVWEVGSKRVNRVPALMVSGRLEATAAPSTDDDEAVDGSEVLALCEEKIGALGAGEHEGAVREEAVRALAEEIRALLTERPLVLAVEVEEVVRDAASGEYVLRGLVPEGAMHGVELRFAASETRLVESKRGELVEVTAAITSVGLKAKSRGALEPERLGAAVRAGEEAALERGLRDSDLSEYYLVVRGIVIGNVDKTLE